MIYLIRSSNHLADPDVHATVILQRCPWRPLSECFIWMCPSDRGSYRFWHQKLLRSIRSCFIWALACCFCSTTCSAKSLTAPAPLACLQVYLAARAALGVASAGTALRPARFRQLASAGSLPGRGRKIFTLKHFTAMPTWHPSERQNCVTSQRLIFKVLFLF